MTHDPFRQVQTCRNLYEPKDLENQLSVGCDWLTKSCARTEIYILDLGKPITADRITTCAYVVGIGPGTFCKKSVQIS